MQYFNYLVTVSAKFTCLPPPLFLLLTMWVMSGGVSPGRVALWSVGQVTVWSITIWIRPLLLWGRCVCVCVFGGYKEIKKKQNKNKGSVGYLSVLSQVCQTKISIFIIFYILVWPLSIARWSHPLVYASVILETVCLRLNLFFFLFIYFLNFLFIFKYKYDMT